MKTVNVMIVGVGGQGTLLSSRILGAAFLQKGYDVKVSEVHGMSQRGGSVVTYVRYGDKVYSPVVAEGEADYILAFEKLEAARYAHYLKKGATIIVNNRSIDPMPVITGAAQYPEGVLDELKAKGAHVVEIDALSLAKRAGSEKAVNIVLLGVFSNFLDMPEDFWLEIIKQQVKPQFYEINERAFKLGSQIK